MVQQDAAKMIENPDEVQGVNNQVSCNNCQTIITWTHTFYKLCDMAQQPLNEQ